MCVYIYIHICLYVIYIFSTFLKIIWVQSEGHKLHTILFLLSSFRTTFGLSFYQEKKKIQWVMLWSVGIIMPSLHSLEQEVLLIAAHKQCPFTFFHPTIQSHQWFQDTKCVITVNSKRDPLLFIPWEKAVLQGCNSGCFFKTMFDLHLCSVCQSTQHPCFEWIISVLPTAAMLRLGLGYKPQIGSCVFWSGEEQWETFFYLRWLRWHVGKNMSSF